MAITVVKRGISEGDTPMRGTCRQCKCEITCLRSDCTTAPAVDVSPWVKCPSTGCNTIISVAPDGEKAPPDPKPFIRPKFEYTILYADSYLDLDKKVNFYLKDGWELHGRLFVISSTQLYQPMVRYRSVTKGK